MTATLDHPRINKSKRMDTMATSNGVMEKTRSISQSEYDLLAKTREIILYPWIDIDTALHVLKYLIEHQAMRDSAANTSAAEAWNLFARQGAEYVSALLGRSAEELDAGWNWATKLMDQGRRKPKRRGARKSAKAQ
jgi:hypothetical protein